MRLYLSASGMGERAGSLLALLGGESRAALIENALDHVPMAERILRRETDDPARDLAQLGIATEPVDLRDYTGRGDALSDHLSSFDLVWIADGDPFVLRQAMHTSGFDEAIIDLLETDTLAYGGSGAGAIVASPCMGGFEPMRDPSAGKPLAESAPAGDGLGLIDHALVPHYRSAHPLASGAEQAVRFFAGRGLRYRTLADGEVLVWTESRNAAIHTRRSA